MSVATGTPTHPTQVQLETTLKSTLHALSLILSFYSSVQQLGVLNYTPHAPRQLTNQLKLEAAKYDQICGQLEATILRAIATLERDALKAAQVGQLVVPPPPPPSTSLTSEVPPAGDAAPGSTTGETAVLDLTAGDTSTSATDTNMTDVGFLVLTGDASTTRAADATLAIPVGTDSQATASTTGGDQQPPGLSLLGLSVPAIESLSVELANSQDLSALLGSIVTDASFPSTTFSADSSLLPLSGTDLSSTTAPSDLDLNAMLSMLSGSNASTLMGTGNDAEFLPAFDPGSLNLTTTATTATEGQGAQGAQGMDVDLDSLDFSNMDAGSLDELLKSLGAGAPA